jgi:NitT/TauT family transport system permease protein
VATVYRFSWWQRFRWVELPSATIGLVWNSMMGMAGGWFFLAISEAFQLGDKDFRVAGLGSYMSKAVEEGDTAAMLWAILAMVVMIVALDQLLWRPVIVWAQKFRVEEGGHQEAASSWFLNWLRRSHILKWLGRLHEHGQRLLESRRAKHPAPSVESTTTDRWAGLGSSIAFVLLLGVLAYGAWQLLKLLWGVSLAEWGDLTMAAGVTLVRVLVSTGLGTLWAVPAGLAIGLSPRLSRLLQPVVQVVASFPAPMLFPLVIAAMDVAGLSLGWGSILLMLLGTQWYILFNVVAGAMAIPADLREAARSYRIAGWQRFWVLYFPAIFPYLVTGWVTAAGGAWNASIVSEYVTYKGQVELTWGLGSLISQYAKEKDLAQLTASLVVMATVVVLFNRTVWRRLYRLAEERFALNK